MESRALNEITGASAPRGAVMVHGVMILNTAELPLQEVNLTRVRRCP
jgi:hypothetical protein